MNADEHSVSANQRTIDRFEIGQRIRIVRAVPILPLTRGRKEFRGCEATVARVLRRGPGAWVNLDRWPAEVPRMFPSLDDHRRNHLFVRPEECERLTPRNDLETADERG